MGRETVAASQHVAQFRCDSSGPAAQPGQFVQLNLPGVYWPRPFSLLDWSPGGAGEAASFRLLFAEAGRGTRALAALEPGCALEGHGPLGRPFPEVHGPTWMVAGGYGVAPLLFASRSSQSPAHIRFFYGAARAQALWRTSQLDSFSPTLCTEDGSHGVKGTVLDAVRSELRRTGERPMVFACGPMALLSAVAALGKEMQLKAYVSVETPMPCGIGVCRGCAMALAETHASEARRYAMACEDGPVFEAGELDWEMEAACRV